MKHVAMETEASNRLLRARQADQTAPRTIRD
jgi:hypothetical protein